MGRGVPHPVFADAVHHPSRGSAVWGLQVRREIPVRGEVDRWVPTPRGQQGQVSRYGHLIFDDRLTPPRRIELLPYTLGQFERRRTAARHRPSRRHRPADRHRPVGDAVGDRQSGFRAGRGGPAVLNLSIFESFFPEKRPFFLEDSRIFVPPYNQIQNFYSRRIGQTPGRFELAVERNARQKPDNTTILGAGKLTGKSSVDVRRSHRADVARVRDG